MVGVLTWGRAGVGGRAGGEEEGSGGARVCLLWDTLPGLPDNPALTEGLEEVLPERKIWANTAQVPRLFFRMG